MNSYFDVLAAASLNISYTVVVKEGAIPKHLRDRKIEVNHLSFDQNEKQFLIYINGSKPLKLDASEGFIPQSAGSSYNVAYGLNKLGQKTGITAAIGNDMFASQLSESLEKEGIPLMIIPRGMGTPTTIAAIEENGNYIETTLFVYKPPYHLPVRQAVELLNDKKYRFVLGTGVRQSEIELLTRLFTLQGDNFLVPNESVCQKATDMDVQVLLRITNILQVNFEEAQALSNCVSGDLEQMATVIANMGPKKVIITLGAEGAFLARQTSKKDKLRLYNQKAFHASVVDTDGAGDGFSVGFVHALLQGATIRKCLEVGTYVAARNIEGRGGYGGMPPIEPVAHILKRS